MSSQAQVGATPRAQRAAQRAESRDGSRAGSLAPSEDSTGPTAVTRGRGGRGFRQPKPILHDGDDNTPPVQNKTSKAYGSAGKMATAIQQMNPFTGHRDPVVAMEKAMGTAPLPPIAEESWRSQARQSTRTSNSNSNPDDTQSMLDAQLQGATTSSPMGKTEAFTDTGRTPEGSWLLETFWGNRGGFPSEPHWSDPLHPWFDDMPWYWQLCGGIAHFALNFFLLLFYTMPMSILANAKRIATVLIFITIIFLSADMLAGPLLPTSYDLPGLKAIRPHTALWNTPSPPCSGLDALKDQLSSDRHYHDDLVKRVEYLEQQWFWRKDGTPKSQPTPEINWFEPGQGARVNPYLTSPSFSRQTISWSQYLASLFTLQPHTRVPLGGSPTEVLTDWTDGGLDRWCAPPSRGKLQVTIVTAKKVAPRELIIEHIAKLATIRIGMAPREVELWAEITDPDVHFELHKAIVETQPHLLDLSSPQAGKELDETLALPPSFLPIGRFWYDINRNQASQTFAVPFAMAMYKVRSSSFAVRVNSNWGSLNATCINRLLLHGYDKSDDEERLEKPL